jgi:hypothetical protein
VSSSPLPNLEVRTFPDGIVYCPGMTQPQPILLFEPGNDVFGFRQVLFLCFGDEVIGRLARYFFDIIKIG